ncbi:tail fiber domain-containing protein [Dyadobacter sp. 676]|uniref:Tail fiber domain-containing protein n=1 Tax=Dyadobacter sp. 676 TaxID=3088362 RepID=A0AAU8FK07_9BACT
METKQILSGPPSAKTFSSALFAAGFLITSSAAFAQVKIGDNPTVINAGSALEIESTNKGLLMPRISLTNTTTWGLAGTPAAGMSVYNTNAGITSTNTSYPAAGIGEYYFDGTGWVSKKGGSGGDIDWHITGNAGTDGTLNFAGTTDAQDFVLKANNFRGLRLNQAAKGSVWIGDDPLNGNPAVADNAPRLIVSSESNFTTLNSPTGGNGKPGIFIYNHDQTANNYANVVFGAQTGNGAAQVGAAIAAVFGTRGSTFELPADLTFSTNININQMTEWMRIKNNGNVGIGTTAPTQKLHVIGNILASGTITPSDIRIKKDITDNTYGLKEVMKLRTIGYRYKDQALGRDHKIGFVAQQMIKVMPELVTTAGDSLKTLGVNYAEMTVVLTKAIQEQQAEIDALKSENQTLKAQVAKVNDLAEKLADIEAKMHVTSDTGASAHPGNAK